MGKQVFNVKLIGDITIELDDEVIKAGASNDFQSVIGFRMSPKQVAEHLAYQMVVNNATLEQLDGFADQPNGNARIIRDNWNYEVE
jgi:hypothetical protein